MLPTEATPDAPDRRPPAPSRGYETLPVANAAVSSLTALDGRTRYRRYRSGVVLNCVSNIWSRRTVRVEKHWKSRIIVGIGPTGQRKPRTVGREPYVRKPIPGLYFRFFDSGLIRLIMSDHRVSTRNRTPSRRSELPRRVAKPASISCLNDTGFVEVFVKIRFPIVRDKNHRGRVVNK
jgi:hypothetical protein